MTAQQKSKLLQGIVFGLFFQFVGWKMRDWSAGDRAVKVGGTVAIAMGLIIFAWGCSHLVAAKNLRREFSALGMLSLIGLAILWFWPPQPGASSDESARA